jgi:hypothetical protein
MKIFRVVIYEGEEAALQAQLGRSMPTGLKELTSVRITVSAPQEIPEGQSGLTGLFPEWNAVKEFCK